MAFYQLVKRISIDIAMLFALLVSLLFFYDQVIPFVRSAVALGYINGQSVSYIVYALLCILLPLRLLAANKHSGKRRQLKYICFAFGAIILFGTVCDLVTFKFFSEYSFVEGDMIFINILWNMPNLFGAVLSIVIAALYFFLGKCITKVRRMSFIIYTAIFILSVCLPFIYTYVASGSLPRMTYLEKALFLVPESIFLLIAFSISVTSRELWKEHIWG